MKKTILALLIGFISLSVVTAQDSVKNKNISKEERQELKKMRKEMNLTEEQKSKLEAICSERKAARATMTKDEKVAANQKYREQVKAVLDDKQEGQMKEIHKKRKEFKKN